MTMNTRFTPEALTKLTAERRWLFVNSRNATLVPPVAIEYANKVGGPIILPSPALEGGDRATRTSSIVEWFKKLEKAAPAVVLASADVVELLADPTFAVILNVTPFSPVAKEGVEQFELTSGVEPSSDEESVEPQRATGFIHPQSAQLADTLFGSRRQPPQGGATPAEKGALSSPS